MLAKARQVSDHGMESTGLDNICMSLLILIIRYLISKTNCINKIHIYWLACGELHWELIVSCDVCFVSDNDETLHVMGDL